MKSKKEQAGERGNKLSPKGKSKAKKEQTVIGSRTKVGHNKDKSRE